MGLSASSSRRPRGAVNRRSHEQPSSGSPSATASPPPTGGSALKPVCERSSPRTMRPSASTARRSSASSARACVPSWRVRTCSTANGCAASTAGSTRARSFAPRTRCSRRSECRHSPSAPGSNSPPPARQCVSARWRRATNSPTRNADRPAGPRRPLEPRNRHAALPQPPNGRVAPAEGIQQTRDQLPQRPRERLGLRARSTNRLTPRPARRAAQTYQGIDQGLTPARRVAARRMVA